jgi:hypothetical protein
MIHQPVLRLLVGVVEAIGSNVGRHRRSSHAKPQAYHQCRKGQRKCVVTIHDAAPLIAVVSEVSTESPGWRAGLKTHSNQSSDGTI